MLAIFNNFKEKFPCRILDIWMQKWAFNSVSYMVHRLLQFSQSDCGKSLSDCIFLIQ